MGECLTPFTVSLPVAAGLAWMLDPGSWWVILQVALGLGFVIFVHELGHFLVAKACGVKCEKFYLGFDVGGLKLAKFQWGETEYGIGALPLGGYVKMLGQDDNPAAAVEEARRARGASDHHDLPSGDLPAEPTSDPHPAWDPRSYPAQSVPKRMAIISAGVIMNVIFAVLMASWAFGLGVREMTCAISSVRPGGAAWKAGLRTGDEIVRIGRQRRPIFNDLRYGVTLGSVREGIEIEYRRPGDEATVTARLHPDTDLGAPTIGVTNPWSLTLPQEVPRVLAGAAAKATPALAAGDTIRSVDGRPVDGYADLVVALAAQVDQPVRLEVERAAAAGDRGDPTTVAVMLPPQPTRVTGMTMTARGISAIQDGSPAAAAGLRVGERLVAIDGEDPGDPLALDERLARRAGEHVRLTVAAADGASRDVDVVPRAVTWIDNEANWPASPASLASLGVALPVDADVAAVVPGGPAERAGVVAGDRVVRAWFLEPDTQAGTTVDEGVELSSKTPNWPAVAAVLQRVPAGTRLRLALEGAGGEREVTLEPTDAPDRFVVDRGLAFEPVYTLVRADSLSAALDRGLRRAGQDLSLVWGFLGKLTRSEISPRLLGGPIEIAKQAGRSAQEGFGRLLLFLTMLSANLAVVNFLPIPVLDGGHMVFLLYELVRGKPPSEKVVMTLSYLGLALILTLMMFVFGLDLGLIPRR